MVWKGLHWLTVLLVAAQVAIGYAIDSSGHGRGRGRGRSSDSGHGRGRGRGGDLDVFGDPVVTAHVVIGVTIVVVTLGRLWWRRRRGLPPWAPTLSSGERRLATFTERALYTMLLATPITGIWLVTVSDDALWLHVAAHVALYTAIAAHVGLILKHQFGNRDHLLRRMT